MQKTPTHPHRTTAAALMAAAAVMPVAITAAQAGEGYSTGGMSSLAQREMVRRQQQVAESDRLRDEARAAYADENYKEAYDKYTQALQLLPDAPLLQDRRDFLKASLGDAAMALSEEYRRFGKYDEARTMLESVVEADPTNFTAQQRLEWIDDPIRTNPALTEEHSQNIDKVRQGLYMAGGYYDLGQFDEARAAYQDVLRIDPYNSAARRGMERVDSARSSYYQAAYDQTRAELLAQVDAAWEMTVPVEAPTFDGNESLPTKSAGATLILQKLRNIVVPIIDFEDTSVEEAIDYLRVRSIELDTFELNPDDKGINFVIRKPRGGAGGDDGLEVGGGAQAEIGTQRIAELRLRNVPLAEALDYICEATNLRWSVDDFAVTIKPITDTDEALITRTFNVPPDFVNRIGGEGGDGGGGNIDPFAPDAGADSSSLKPRKSVIEALKDNGVKFPPDASAQFFPANSTLLVRNTPTNLDLVETIVAQTNTGAPKQVKISTKFVEVAQENSDELGFDWIISPFGLSANHVFLGGGTVGSGQPRTEADFISPVNGINIPGVGGGLVPGTPVTNIVTASNRTGDGAVARDSINAILNNPNRASQNASPAPGILSLTGLFSDGQVQMIMRGLSQKKGTDLMTAPSVTARSGEKATIEIIREFIYPTEYEPPELPNQVGGGIGGGGGLGGLAAAPQIFPVTPATPTAFETRNTGVTLEIAPNIGSNDFVIDLNFAPEIVEFEGFINYGSPIQSPSSDALGNPTTVTITDNRIEMPVFSTRRVNTALTIFDGYTVAVGGLMREDVQNVEDKVPILGDIPIIGRLFQTTAENRIKSNLIIFVTAEIIDATGRPINRGGAPTDGMTGDPMGGSVLPPLGG